MFNVVYGVPNHFKTGGYPKCSSPKKWKHVFLPRRKSWILWPCAKLLGSAGRWQQGWKLQNIHEHLCVHTLYTHWIDNVYYWKTLWDHIYIYTYIYIHKRWSIFINSTYRFINSRSYVYHWYRPSRGEPDDFVAVPPSSSAATLRGAGGGRAGERNWGVIGRVMFNEIPFNPMKFHTKNRLNIWSNMIKAYSTSIISLKPALNPMKSPWSHHFFKALLPVVKAIDKFREAVPQLLNPGWAEIVMGILHEFGSSEWIYCWVI